jgi:hypothetical protein
MEHALRVIGKNPEVVRLCEKRRIQVASYFVERIGKVKPEDI